MSQQNILAFVIVILKDNCFEQMSSSIQGRVERVQLWEMWSEIQTKSWHKSYFCFKRMFRSRKRTVTPYDDITEGLKDIYKKRLLPLEKVSWSWKPWCYRAWSWYKRLIQSSTKIVSRKIKTRHTSKKALVVITVWGTGHASKSDEFSERFQTVVDLHPSEWSPSLEMCMHFILHIWPSYLLAYIRPYPL